MDRFAKLPEQFGFAIEYTDNMTNLGFYEPDFIVVTKDGIHYIAETKGLEDVNVANKESCCALVVREQYAAYREVLGVRENPANRIQATSTDAV